MSKDTTADDPVDQPAAATEQTEQIEQADATQRIERADPTQRIEQVEATAALPTTEPAAQATTGSDAPFWDPTAEPGPAETAHPPVAAGHHSPVAASHPSADAYAGPAYAYATAPDRPAAPTGPHLPAIVLGVLVLVVAAMAVLDATGSLTVDWNVTGPIGIVVVGGALVLLGALGLAGNRRRG